MSAKDLQNNSSPKILLIGDVSGAFTDAAMPKEMNCEVHNNIFDGIESAAKGRFDAIGIVTAGVADNLESAIRTLRADNADAKIILFAKMPEEPLAIQLAASAANGTKLVDDYLICPVKKIDFQNMVNPNHTEASTQVFLDEKTEAKLKELEQLATTDELTGLKNRRYIWEFARQIIDYAKTRGGNVTLLMFDIDDFKHYNDVYSHLAGDDILKQAAVLMERSCRAHDVVGRIGGDEFAVIFWDDPDKLATKQDERRTTVKEHPKEAIFIAKRFRRELNKAELNLLGTEGKGVLTISGGLASFPRDGATIQELFAQADKALLEAKRSGKNRIYLVGTESNDIANIE